jgi:hypothetical protein
MVSEKITIPSDLRTANTAVRHFEKSLGFVACHIDQGLPQAIDPPTKLEPKFQTHSTHNKTSYLENYIYCDPETQ